MKIVYLKQARKDLQWWNYYYYKTFPEGQISAYRKFKSIIILLSENPFAAPPVDGTDLRRFAIPRTPFVVVYRVQESELEIAHVWDMRSQRPKNKIEEF